MISVRVVVIIIFLVFILLLLTEPVFGQERILEKEVYTIPSHIAPALQQARLPTKRATHPAPRYFAPRKVNYHQATYYIQLYALQGCYMEVSTCFGGETLAEALQPTKKRLQADWAISLGYQYRAPLHGKHGLTSPDHAWTLQDGTLAEYQSALGRPVIATTKSGSIRFFNPHKGQKKLPVDVGIVALDDTMQKPREITARQVVFLMKRTEKHTTKWYFGSVRFTGTWDDWLLFQKKHSITEYGCCDGGHVLQESWPHPTTLRITLRSHRAVRIAKATKRR